MRTAIVWIVIIALVGGGVYAFRSGFINVGVNASNCRQDEEIDETLREEASKAALAFIDALLKPDVGPAYQQLTARLKSMHSLDVFTDTAKKIQASGPFSGMKVDRQYQPSLVGGKQARVICGSLSSAEHWVSVEANPGDTQIQMIVLAQTRNNDWAFTLWLIKEGDVWRVQGYYLSMASMAGQFAPELLTAAREQEKKGHGINAQMLYIATSGVIDRGPSFQLGLKQDFDADLEKHKVPAELSGGAPHIWRLDGKDYSVERVEVFGIGKQLILSIVRRDRDWDGKDNIAAERLNKVFLEAFIKAHPEYAETFGALVARVLSANGDKSWGTVFDAKKGYQ